MGGGELGMSGGKFLPLCFLRYFLTMDQITNNKSSIPLQRATAFKLSFDADAIWSAGFSVGNTKGAGVYFLSAITCGVGLIDALGDALVVALGLTVAVVPLAVQPHVAELGQSGFRQKPFEQKRPALQL